MATNVVPFPSANQQVLVVPGESIYISGLQVDSPEIADEVATVQETARPEMVRERTVLGFRAAALARRSRDVDSLTTGMERVAQQVERQLKALPELLARELGGPDGRVSVPIVQAAKDAADRIGERMEQARRSVEEQVGPGDSALGRQLAEIARLLDPAVDGSAPKQIAQAASDLGADGSPVVAAINKAVEQQVKPLRDLVDSLSQRIAVEDAVAEALQQTPAKGTPYEERVLSACVEWAKPTGSSVEHVGADNKPGDVVIEPAASFGASVGPIVLECRARNSAAGRLQVARDCDTAMVTREARAAIYLSETDAGLAKELGCWAEGETEHGPWIVTTHEYLLLAIRWAILLQQLAAARGAKQEVDEMAIASQLDRIRTSLRGCKDIRTKAGQLHKLATAIDERADHMRIEISAAVSACEEQLRPLDHDQGLDEEAA